MGYDSDDHRAELRANNNEPIIPCRKSRIEEILYDKEIYKLRRRIEMFFDKLKEKRRLAVRHEKTDRNFLGFIAVASLLIHLC